MEQQVYFPRGSGVPQPRIAWPPIEVRHVLIISIGLPFERALAIGPGRVPIFCQAPQPEEAVQDPVPDEQELQLLLEVDRLVVDSAIG